VTREGEVMPMFQRDLLLGDGSGDGRLFLVWPIIVEHKINHNSPLWDISADDLHRRHFEIIIILEGIVESTGMTTQARTSYLPAEVLWGHRFERLVSYQRENGQYLVDYSRFNNIVAVEMSPNSAKDRASGRRRNSNDDSDEDTQDQIPDDENLMRLGSIVGERSLSISITTASNSRLNGMNVAALAAFDLQNEFAGAGIDDFTAQINDICQFNAGST